MPCPHDCFCDSVADTACRVPTCKCRVVSSNHSPPYRANKVFRGLTECQSVPCEGSNPHCDARTGWGWVRHFYVSVRLCALCRAKRATNPATALFALELCVLCALCVRLVLERLCVFCTQITLRAQSFSFSLAYYAGAGGVVNFVTTRERRGGDVSEAV